MSIIRWKPFAEIDRFLDELSLGKKFQELSADVYEKNGNVIIEMHTAGIPSDKLDITVEDDYVKVCGLREEEKTEKERDYFIKEIRRGSFERIIDLPTAVSADNAKAEFKDGVLKITLPKLNKKEGRKIKIEPKAES